MDSARTPGVARLARGAAALLFALSASSAPLAAQSDSTRDSTARPIPIPVLGAGFAAGALAAMPVDARWDRAVGGAGPQASHLLREADRLGDNWGSPGAIVAAGALWLGARIAHDSVRARYGARALEALALSGTITGGIKGIAGRARPYADPGQPGSWVIARGIRDGRYQSFPSGHATAAFAFASAITSQLNRDQSPIRHWAGPLLYALAGVTAFSRTYDHDHWASDVVAGAGVGTLSGLVVSRWHDVHRGSWIDKILLGR
ncbi:MAG TPA: phosphatase PAP2 family protein [Gemmatimonadaceae bacterium]|nr:phosphatase PAP2 family protein [Gemmatimonadaceae bacterium]